MTNHFQKNSAVHQSKMSAVDANSDDKKDETHVMRPALSVFTTE